MSHSEKLTEHAADKVQEWTVIELQYFDGTSHWFLSDCPETHFDTENDAVKISDAHNAALAAERERGQQECNRLDAFWQNEVVRQISAEREAYALALQMKNIETTRANEAQKKSDEYLKQAIELKAQLSAEGEKHSYSKLHVDLAEARRDNEQLREQLAAAEAQDKRHMEKAHKEVMLERRTIQQLREQLAAKFTTP